MVAAQCVFADQRSKQRDTSGRGGWWVFIHLMTGDLSISARVMSELELTSQGVPAGREQGSWSQAEPRQPIVGLEKGADNLMTTQEIKLLNSTSISISTLVFSMLAMNIYIGMHGSFCVADSASCPGVSHMSWN